MANNIEHVNIPDVQRHEPKGASTAGANTFLVADGAGNTTFRELQKTDVAPLNLGFSREDALVASNNTTIDFPMPLEPKTIPMGNPVESPGGSIAVGANGNILLKQPGTYFYACYVNATAEGTTPTDKATMAFRLIDANGINRSSVVQSTMFAGTSDDLIVGAEFIHTSVPLELKLEAVLVSEDPTITKVEIKPTTIGSAGWASIPAANIVVERFEVN